MSDNLNTALAVVNLLSKDELLSLGDQELRYIVRNLNTEEIREFIFAKNIKIFGGINEYVENFFSSNTINKIKAMANGGMKIISKSGAIKTMNKMLTYDELTPENRNTINMAILELNNDGTAPAAGGVRRKKNAKSKKSRRS
jgi:hypothetical protein